MTQRQQAGIAVFFALLLGFAFFYWLAPILNYQAQRWVFYVVGPLIVSAWGWYYRSNFAKRSPK